MQAATHATRAVHSSLLLTIILLGACAVPPSAGKGGHSGGSDFGPRTSIREVIYTGILQVSVTDQNGTVLDNARIDVVSTGRDSMRVTSYTDRSGAAQFIHIPPEVRIEVTYEYREEKGFTVRVSRGSGSKDATVEQTGSTSVQVPINVTVETTESLGDPGSRGRFGL